MTAATLKQMVAAALDQRYDETLLECCRRVMVERAALAARLTELEQRLARVAQLAHDRDDDTFEKRSQRLGQCAEVSWDHTEESFSKDPLKKNSTLKWASLAQQLADAESELAALRLEKPR